MNAFNSFCMFAEQVGRVRLSVGQRALCLVCFDGLEPNQLGGAESEAAAEIFGVETIPPLARAIVEWVKGARIGGTLLAALRVLHLGLTVPLDALAPGELAFGIIVAPDLRLAQQALRYVKGVIGGVPALKGRVLSERETSITLSRGDGRTVAIECLPATQGGSALRGRTLFAAHLSESAFFRDENYAVNDVELYRAVTPRLTVPGAQLIIESTPWAETGLLYDLFTANHGHPSTAIAAHCPTLRMRDEQEIRDVVSREVERDSDNAAREFGALFLSGGAGLFFDPRAIADSIDFNLVLPLPRRSDASYFVGADWGFIRDSTAAVALEALKKMLTVADVLELRPEKGLPLKPSETVGTVAGFARGFGVRNVVSDAHYRQSIDEHLTTASLGLIDAPPGAAGKAAMFMVTRQLMREGRLRLPNHKRLLQQLREVVSKPTSAGQVSISSPRWAKGGHGDLVSALCAAAHQANEGNIYSFSPPSLPAARADQRFDLCGANPDEAIVDCYGKLRKRSPNECTPFSPSNISQQGGY